MSNSFSINYALHTILSFKRPARSASEQKMITQIIVPTGATPDPHGNYILRIGTTPIMWSCHTDTMHKIGGKQKLYLDTDKEGHQLLVVQDSNCLGADDGAGIWLMCEMIERGVEGLYIFHRDEEIGGKGSQFIVKETPELVKGIRAAIALDRYGYTSVITHQRGRCCSDAFARALGEQLGDYKPDSTGLFTDTANYTKLIPECTNLSVGYEGHHTPYESQDFLFLALLADKLEKLNIGTLPIERDPTVIELRFPKWDRKPAKLTPIKSKLAAPKKAKNTQEGEFLSAEELGEVADLVERFPISTALLLEQLGYNALDMEQWVNETNKKS